MPSSAAAIALPPQTSTTKKIVGFPKARSAHTAMSCVTDQNAVLSAAADARPAAMVRTLHDFELATPPDLELVEPDMEEAARINDAAYGFPGDFERAFAELPPEPAHLYLALSDGVPACTVLTYEEDGECGIYLVATLPEARGRGLATALMIHALLQARARGCTTTSLQATQRGRPVYQRLGYRDIGAVHMWERRRPPYR